MSHVSGVKKPTLTHANSMAKLPKFGVESKDELTLGRLFDDGINMWGLDVFKVGEYSNGHPLTSIMYAIFKVRCITWKSETKKEAIWNLKF